MADEPRGRRVHERWAHFRFSVIGQLLAAPPARGELKAAIGALSDRTWQHPLSGRPVRFGASTIERWFYRALRERRDPVAVLRRKMRADAGQQPAISDAVRQAILAQYPEQAEKTVFEVFEAERPLLMSYRGAFNGFHAMSAAVSKTCLFRFDRNKYSVKASAVGRPVDIHAYADRIVITQDGTIVGEHARRFGRNQVVYDPWHYVTVLARKPGALRNGAPFKDWPLPASLEKVRRKLAGSPTSDARLRHDGDRQMVKVLTAVLTDGLAAVEAACAEALTAGLASADVILNARARRQQPAPSQPIAVPERLTLALPPVADCARYDALRSPLPIPVFAAAEAGGVPL